MVALNIVLRFELLWYSDFWLWNWLWFQQVWPFEFTGFTDFLGHYRLCFGEAFTGSWFLTWFKVLKWLRVWFLRQQVLVFWFMQVIEIGLWFRPWFWFSFRQMFEVRLFWHF